VSEANIPVLDMSHADGALFAALAKAQQAAVTVGKDARNQQANYNYASAEAMMRAARAAMADTGLAIMSTWTQQASDIPEGMDIGNQFVCATVTEHFVVTHEGGGWIGGRAEIDAIASKRTPPHKAVAASATYMHGFVLRHLLNLDRAEDGEHAVDSQPNEYVPPRQGQRRRPPHEVAHQVARRPGGWRAGLSKEAAQAEAGCRAMVKERIELIRELGVSREAMEHSTTALLAEILDIEASAGGYDAMAPRFSLEQWGKVNAALRADIASLQDTKAQREEAGK
jgi:hypothetical protein